MINGNLILVVDDEVQIRRLLEIALSSNGYKVALAENGQEAIAMAATINPAMVILDLGLPDIDGTVVLRKLREWFIGPVLVLSVRSSEMDIINALDGGANDYLTKPFRTGELLARLRTAKRTILPGSQSDTLLSYGRLEVNIAKLTAKKDGVIIHLTSTEFSLLSFLARNPGRVLTHQMILKEVWGYHYAEQTQYVRVFITQLRKKIEDDPAAPEYIITEAGIGYRFTEVKS